jgi:hypothetical protein
MSIVLRTSISPYGDATKGSVLSQSELDGNFISLKGDVIYTAEELGGVVGFILVIIFTALYIIIFALPGDYNWIDIFSGKQHLFNTHITW